MSRIVPIQDVSELRDGHLVAPHNDAVAAGGLRVRGAIFERIKARSVPTIESPRHVDRLMCQSMDFVVFVIAD